MALPMFDKNDPRYLQLLAQMARSGNIDPMTMESQVEGALNPSGMAASGYAKDAPAPDPKGSVEGRQRISDNQRKYAQSLRGDAAPQGRTAGPLNVYYGPNWGESLAHAGKQVMGGYMEGQANKEDASIDEARQLEKAVAQKTEQDRYDADLALKTRGVEGDEAAAAATAAYRIKSLEAANAPSKEWKDVTFWKPPKENGEDWASGEDTVTFQRHENGSYRSTDKKPLGQEQSAAVGTLTPYKAGDAGSIKPTKRTAADNVAEYRANTFGDALTGIKKTMVEYDPASGEAFIDKYANSNDMLRWASSEKGQQYNSDASTLKEAALRTSTGAAAPNKENSEYMTTLIPGPWDKPGTVDFKMAKLETIHTRLLELAGLEETTQEDLNAESDILLVEARREEAALDALSELPKGEVYEDSTHKYRIFDGELQSEKK